MQHLPPHLRAECDVAMQTVKYTRNSALAAVARVLALDVELRLRMHGREPSVIEALLMSAHAVMGMAVAAVAVGKLMSMIDALPPPLVTSSGASDVLRSLPVSAIDQLMQHVLRLRLALPLFEVEVAHGLDGSVSYRASIIAVEHSAGGVEHDEVLARGSWKASRRTARESAAATLLQM